MEESKFEVELANEEKQTPEFLTLMRQATEMAEKVSKIFDGAGLGTCAVALTILTDVVEHQSPGILKETRDMLGTANITMDEQ